MTDEKDIDMSAKEEAQEPEAPSPDDSAVEGDAPPEDMASEEPTPAPDESAVESEASPDQEMAEELPGEEPERPPPEDADKGTDEGDVSEEDAEAAMMAMLEDLPEEEHGASPEDIDFGTAEVSGAEFQQLSERAGGAAPSNIEMLMDVDLPVAIELGRTKMSINDILALGPGSVVELNKLAGEPVDLLVNYKVVARGEVVVVDENFGLRITQLLTPEERLKSLANE
jgi:flagellar motor switch protein FliN/FliY